MSKTQTANWKAKGPFNYQMGVSVLDLGKKQTAESNLRYSDSCSVVYNYHLNVNNLFYLNLILKAFIHNLYLKFIEIMMIFF